MGFFSWMWRNHQHLNHYLANRHRADSVHSWGDVSTVAWRPPEGFILFLLFIFVCCVLMDFYSALNDTDVNKLLTRDVAFLVLPFFYYGQIALSIATIKHSFIFIWAFACLCLKLAVSITVIIPWSLLHNAQKIISQAVFSDIRLLQYTEINTAAGIDTDMYRCLNRSVSMGSYIYIVWHIWAIKRR